jgi:hypothetical protein
VSVLLPGHASNPWHPMSGRTSRRPGDHRSMATHHRGYLPIHQARNQVALLVGLLGYGGNGMIESSARREALFLPSRHGCMTRQVGFRLGQGHEKAHV